MASLYGLLFTMGFRIGRNEEVGSNIAQIGLLALLFAVATIIGTIIGIYLLYRIFFRTSSAFKNNKKKETNQKGSLLLLEWEILKEPLTLLCIVVAGILTGFFLPFFKEITGENITVWVLNLLIFLVGFQFARQDIRLKEVLLHPDLLLLPAGTVIGTLAGGIAVSFFLSLSWGKAAAVASGFGWYSLSGVLITRMGDPVLGSAAFLSNMLRETIALFIIPLIARTRYPNIAIGVAGATSMDVTLPLIERSCGAKKVPLSITNGAILSLLVPLLVPLFFSIG